MYYSKINDTPKVWVGNKFGNEINKLDFLLMKSLSTEGWRGVNFITWETGRRYVQSESF